jgi:hypothetical protein
MADPSPLCTEVVKLSRNCSILGWTYCAAVTATAAVCLQCGLIWQLKHTDSLPACLWIWNGSVTGIYGYYVGNVNVPGSLL